MNAALKHVAFPLEGGAPDCGESAHRFGPGLVGVLHQPHGPVRQDTAVILLNAGLVHRIGPFRGYVHLARAFAAAGYAVLRFDQGGLGDSELTRHAGVERRVAELQAATELVVNRTGVERFVLGGICSGADDAFYLAGLDPRVSGVILLDGPAYRAGSFWWRRVLDKLLSPREVVRTLRENRKGRPAAEDYREFPPHAHAVAQIERLVARDVRLLFLHTTGNAHYINHRQQFFTSFGRFAKAPQVHLELWRDCDHTFYLRRDRERLQHTLGAWLQREFGASRAPAPLGRG